MAVILLDGGIGNEINVLTSNIILLGAQYRPTMPHRHGISLYIYRRRLHGGRAFLDSNYRPTI